MLKPCEPGQRKMTRRFGVGTEVMNALGETRDEVGVDGIVHVTNGRVRHTLPETKSHRWRPWIFLEAW